MPVTNAIEFGGEIRKRSETLPLEEVVALHRRITIELERRIVLRTPVATGFARGNWEVGIGVTSDVVRRTFRTPSEVFAAAEAELARLTPFAITYVFNNTPYIGALENGSSAQAPAGMVAVSVNEVEVLSAIL